MISMKKNSDKIDLVYKNETAWAELDKIIQQQPSIQTFIICDSNTEKLCLAYLLKKQDFPTPPKVFTISEGEENKNIFTCIDLWNKLSDEGADRNSMIINLGGGVVTDLGGFVASTFQRGISFINIPTSLLAMVDAAVGGKTGIDLGHLKNQVGVINNPRMVIIDTTFLDTLPKRHLNSGIAEMLKHGLIYGNGYWEKMDHLKSENKSELEKLLWESIQIKYDIVAKDPFEANIRKTLNYGHTLGHAIESYYLNNPAKELLLHGEAVAIGLILETYVSHKLLHFPLEDLQNISESILRHYNKEVFDDNDIAEIIELLKFDKKNRNGKVLFVLLQKIGTCSIDNSVTKDLIISAFEFYQNLKKYS